MLIQAFEGDVRNIPIIQPHINMSKLSLSYRMLMMSQTASQEQIKEMLEQAVYQQLFMGENRIMGKNPENTMQFSGVGELLGQFIADLKENLPFILKNKIMEFLKQFEKKFKISFEEVGEKIEVNLMGMGDTEGQEIVMVYMTLTKLLEFLREYAYQTWGQQRIEENYEQVTGKKFDESVADKVQHLAAINDPNISLLYNLSFLALLAPVYGHKAMVTTAKRLVTTKINIIIKKIVETT